MSVRFAQEAYAGPWTNTSARRRPSSPSPPPRTSVARTGESASRGSASLGKSPRIGASTSTSPTGTDRARGSDACRRLRTIPCRLYCPRSFPEGAIERRSGAWTWAWTARWPRSRAAVRASARRRPPCFAGRALTSPSARAGGMSSKPPPREIREGTRGEVLGVPADVAAPGQAEAFIARTAEHFGGLDILIANAGRAASGPFRQPHR